MIETLLLFEVIVLFMAAIHKVAAASDVVVLGIVGENLHLPSNLTDRLQYTVDWVDYVYNVIDEPRTIYSSDWLQSINSHKYIVETDFSLTVLNLSFSDSGQYLCRGQLNSTVLLQQSYYVNIGGKMSCAGENDLTDGRTTTLSCQMDYAGSTLPLLQWSRGSNEKLVSIDEGDIGLARQVLNLVVTPGDDGMNYTCHMMFGTWSVTCVQSLTVKYSVRDLSISPLKDLYEVGEVVRCSAMGQPVPKVVISSTEQIPKSATVVGYGSVIIPSQWLGKIVGLNCSGQNAINGKSYIISSKHTFNVTDKHSANNSSSSENTFPSSVNKSCVVISSIFGAGAVLLIGVAIVCMSRKKISKQRQKVAKPLLTSEPKCEPLTAQQQTTPV